MIDNLCELVNQKKPDNKSNCGLMLILDAVENPFCAVDVMDRLRASRSTKVFMEDEAFVGKLEELREHPNKLMKCVTLCITCVLCIYVHVCSTQKLACLCLFYE